MVFIMNIVSKVVAQNVGIVFNVLKLLGCFASHDYISKFSHE